MSGVFPRTRLIPLGVLVLLAACGEPPQQLPASPPYAAPSGAPISLGPSFPLTGSGQSLPPLTSYPTGQVLPGATLPTATTPAGTVSPTPTPSHAPACTGSPTKSQIITLIKGQPGIPSDPLEVTDGPFCSGDWSFTTVGLTGGDAEQDEPLMAVSTGKGSTLALVAAGSDVCVNRVETEAPPGIRVLACGF